MNRCNKVTHMWRYASLHSESVVSLKKSRLLSLLESSTNSTTQVSTGSPTQNDIFLSSSSRSEMDEEFEKFQVVIYKSLLSSDLNTLSISHCKWIYKKRC